MIALARWVRRINTYFYMIAGGFIAIMALVTSIDVIGRYFRHPITGGIEICFLALAASVFLAWSHTQAEGGHVYLDLVFVRLPTRARRVVGVFSSLISMAFVGAIIWWAVPFSLSSMADGAFTDNLHIPLYPFQFLIVLGGALLFLELIVELVENLRRSDWK
ncbi:TRAP transporter small permease subunit [Thermodesulfobacteriota bacterium]